MFIYIRIIYNFIIVVLLRLRLLLQLLSLLLLLLLLPLLLLLWLLLLPVLCLPRAGPFPLLSWATRGLKAPFGVTSFGPGLFSSIFGLSSLQKILERKALSAIRAL